MILSGIDCSEQYEAMKRGEWPAPHPAVAKAHARLALLIVEAGCRTYRWRAGIGGDCEIRAGRNDRGNHGCPDS